MKKLFLILLVINFSWAQEPEQASIPVNEFEENFYESIKQKGMENYDKAITALEKCLDKDPNNALVYFELGKNYFFDKKYDIAYQNFEKAAQLEPNNRWAWAGMYDVCYEKKDYNKAIPLVEKLITFKSPYEYREDLVSLYMYTQQYDKALKLINELNETVGKSDKREAYKADILRNAKYQGSEKDNLLAQIQKNPKEESNYIQLIYLYSQSNQEEKANEIARQLEKEIPTSDWAQVSLFKFHLNNNEGDKAVLAMNKVLASTKIDTKIKHRILNEFLLYSINNPQYAKDLEKAVAFFENDKTIPVAKEIGKFFQTKNDFANASKYYLKHLANTPNDVETVILLLQAYAENKEYANLAKFSDEQMQLFPAQPEMYYYNGLANNQLKNFKKAKDALETGIDFVVENNMLLYKFNSQLAETYAGLGDVKKRDAYLAKAQELKKK